MMSTEKPTNERHEPRAMLALITLATDMPVPKGIDLYASGILCMTFERLTDGQAWSAHLGGATRTYIYNTRRYLSEGVIRWHGWRVQLHASELGPSDAPLEADTTAALTAIADT